MLGTQAQYRPLSKAALARKRAMAISTVNRVNKLKSRYGAPSRTTQPSRKRKADWRTHIDLDDVEDTLEGQRDEERITGYELVPLIMDNVSSVLSSGPVSTRSDSDLFTVDVHGDEQLKRLQKRKPLKSTEILAQRSAVPPVLSRASSVPSPTPGESSKPRIRVSAAERAQLARLAHRTKNPLDAAQGRSRMPTSEAVKRSGKYDVWAVENLNPDEAALVRAMRTAEAKEYLLPIVRSHNARAPPRARPAVPPLTNATLPSAIQPPEPGSSYNPTYEAHQDLLRAAHQAEEKRVAEAEQAEQVRRRMEAAREAGEEGIEGMLVEVDNETEEEEEEEAEDVEVLGPAKMPGRKTAQQRRKAARALAEKRSRANLAQKRQQLASLTTLKSLHRAVVSAQSEAERVAAERAEKQLAKGLVGMRIGKHIVKGGDIDVQLGEDLAESLRELKPEGNLWRERWGSMVVRGKVEPRVRITAGRKMKTKEYEKHSYKEFDAKN
ncbi:hypothetical protein FRC06_007997 [Ceratobasidium sp. 370]|nr:hypothetical protein FRC06_007997 [Ceratobasidium sp. 370]